MVPVATPGRCLSWGRILFLGQQRRVVLWWAAMWAIHCRLCASAIIDPLGFALQIANQDNQEVIRAVLDMARIEDSSIRHDYMTRFRDLRLQEDAS